MLEEVREFQATVLVATLTGFLLGGLVGARYAGDKFVRISQSSKFSSTMQAQVDHSFLLRDLKYFNECAPVSIILLTQSGVMNDTTKSVINLSSWVTGIYIYIQMMSF